jgi:hypothetical protein
MPKDPEAQLKAMEAKLKAMLNVRFLNHVQAINKFPGDVDDKWFNAIGRFIFEFSRLEYTLRYYVAQKIGLRDQLPVRSRDPKRKRNIAKALVDDHDRTMERLFNECKSLNEDRVRIVHGLWNIAGETRELNYASRYNFTIKTYFRDADELAEKAEQACRLRSEIEERVGMA